MIWVQSEGSAAEPGLVPLSLFVFVTRLFHEVRCWILDESPERFGPLGLKGWVLNCLGLDGPSDGLSLGPRGPGPDGQGRSIQTNKKKAIP